MNKCSIIYLTYTRHSGVNNLQCTHVSSDEQFSIINIIIIVIIIIIHMLT